MIDEKFNWGTNSEETVSIVGTEIFVDKIYEKFALVKEHDIVVDIGSNVGAFGYSIKDKNVK